MISSAVGLLLGCGSSPAGTAAASGASGGLSGSGGQAGAGAAAGGAGFGTSGAAGGGAASGGSSAGTSSAGSGASGSAGAAAVGGAAGGSAGGASGASSGGVSGASGAAGQGGAAPVLEPGLRWLGRVEPTPTGARFSWPGTGFTARFNGTSAKVSIKSGQTDYFQLVVDGQVTLLTTQSGTHDYDLAQNLAAGDHSVTLWRRTEPLNGSAEITKVDFLGGTLLSPPAPFAKRLEIVGDSISVGYGVECKTIGEQFSYATENNYQTFEAIAARELSAELMTLAWSGIGMWRDVGGGTDSEMPTLYLRTLGNEASGVWDFKSYTPGAVLVNLGTNDFAKGDPGQPFVDAYVTFVSGVRGRYPAARLFLAVSPMLGGDNRTKIKAYLDQVKTTRAGQGDQNIAIIEFAQPAQDAWGCGHPNGATHAIMAGVLKQALTQDLGW